MKEMKVFRVYLYVQKKILDCLELDFELKFDVIDDSEKMSMILFFFVFSDKSFFVKLSGG